MFARELGATPSAHREWLQTFQRSNPLPRRTAIPGQNQAPVPPKGPHSSSVKNLVSRS